MKEKMADSGPPSVNARIARCVRELRDRRGFSLAELATKSAVSRSMISLIERGETSPTAVVLEKLSAGFGVPLASLFDDPAVPPSPVFRAQDRVPWRDPQAGYLRRNLSPPNFPSPLQLVEVVLPARARVAYESGTRQAGIDQQIWVLSGTLEVSIGQVTHRLEKDDCLAMQVTQPTAFRNPTRKAARYVVAVATEHTAFCP